MLHGRNSVALAIGADVVDADNERIGRLVECRPGYLVVRRWRFVPLGYVIPNHVVARWGSNRIRLSLSKQDALSQSRARWRA
jgi:hypothetical protein